MSDLVNGIRQIGPSYPVKPVQPTRKDRETGRRKKKRQRPDTERRENDNDETPHIDEHV